jgi:formate hydrogenlyase subunit 4
VADLFNGAFSVQLGTAVTPVLLVFVSWYLLMLAENCRIPFDDPNTHLELTMIHEVIVLDHSGPMLAIIQIASAIKLFVFAALGVRLILPLGGSNPSIDWLVFLSGVIVMAITLGVVESVMARLRMNRIPQLLTAAGVTAAFGFILLVTSR